MLLFYILQNITLTNVPYYLKIYYQIVFQNFKLSVTSTSQFRASALLSPIIGSYDICMMSVWPPIAEINGHPGQKFKWGHTKSILISKTYFLI
jgi:hypothetical protein